MSNERVYERKAGTLNLPFKFDEANLAQYTPVKITGDWTVGAVTASSDKGIGEVLVPAKDANNRNGSVLTHFRMAYAVAVSGTVEAGDEIVPISTSGSGSTTSVTYRKADDQDAFRADKGVAFEGGTDTTIEAGFY